ncbi:MAG TPA: hypothetical protein VNX26_16755 [Candidatus Acidoferrum sp.]|jgi:hypothetical protein|nr:hypothetical protein [Candidatus Acidoferrum sp.]
MKVKRSNAFESFFHEFVRDFGGDVLPEAREGSTADYFFRNQDIIAELKTLTVDQTNDIDRKLTPKVLEWIRKNGQISSGLIQGRKHFVAFKDMPAEIQIFWLGLLKAAVEPLIRDANRQIRDTKLRMNLRSAKGMMLIANGSNFYHDHPDSFRRLIAEVLRKRTPAGDLRFPHINGAVYFSFDDVKSRDERMYFWANLQMKQAPDEDTSPIATFQAELQQGWYKYIQKFTGIEVRQHSQPTQSGP